MISADIEDVKEPPEDSDDVSSGKIMNHHTDVDHIFPADIQTRFEIFIYRNAAAILKNSFQDEFDDIVNALRKFDISKEMIRFPGGKQRACSETCGYFTLREKRMDGNRHFC